MNDMAHGAAEVLPVTAIRISKTNPRKHFDQAALDELSASVRAHGIIQPLLVRPLANGANATFELVAGERRLRAALAVGLPAVPALVRELSDAQALELQVIENLQRADLHPLEEAEGYEQLAKAHGYSVDDLAAKVGKSKAYVYARMKLTALCEEARGAFYDGKLTPSTALLLARIPVAKTQREALKRITEADHRGDVMPVRLAAETIHREFMLRLAEAPFDPTDAGLVPKAGTCGACPKRTGNQPELFEDVKHADVCTDTLCFAAKREAHHKRARETAEASGQKVIHGKEAKEIKPNTWSSQLSGGWIALGERCWDDDKQRTYAKLLGKEAKAVTVLLEDPHTRELVPIAKRSEVAALLEAKGIASNRATPGKTPSKAKKRTPEEIENETYGREIDDALLDAVVTAPAGTLDRDEWVEIALALHGSSDLRARFGFAVDKDIDRGDSARLRAFLATLPNERLALYMLLAAAEEDGYDGDGALLRSIATRRGLDVAAIQAAAVAKAKADRDAAAASRKPKKGGR